MAVGVRLESDAVAETDWPKYLGGSFAAVPRMIDVDGLREQGAKADLQLMFTFA